MRLGPDGYTGIALLGTAGYTMEMAPFKDPKWAIWACSPGAYSVCAKNRSDVWFEPHRWLPSAPGLFGAPNTKPWFSPEFHEFLSNHKGPVFMSEVQPSIPTSVRLPFEQLIEKYGPYFWTSTISYMIAMAIEILQPRAAAGEKVFLGLWGIDMAATEEWAYQRPGCQHFIGLAMAAGINVVLPAETDLMRPPTMYGIGEHNPRHIRFLARKVDLEARIAAATAQAGQLQQQILQLTGAKAEMEYVLAAWSDDVKTDLKDAISFAGEYAKPVGSATKPAETTGAEVLDIANANTG